MKRILIFSPYYKNHVGGLESFVEEFDEKLLETNNFGITLITSLIPDNQAELESGKNVKIIRLPFFDLIPNFPVPKFWSCKFWRGYSSLFKDNYSAVISHTRFFLTSLMAGYLAKKNKIKWIHFEHGSDFVQTKNVFVSFMSRIYDYSLGRLVLRQADEIVAISEAVSDFVFKLVKRKSRVIYRGFDFERFNKVKIKKDFVKKYNGVTKIIFVGRLINGKGVADLLSALEKLRVDKKYICVIVGDGDCKQSLMNQAENGNLKGKVLFTGKLGNNEALSLIKSCDLLINPSYTEGLPTTIIEAVALKKPVIATDVGGTKECFYKKIDLLKPGNIDLLSRKIQSYLVSEKIDYSLEKDFEFVKNKFDWKKSINGFIELI